MPGASPPEVNTTIFFMIFYLDPILLKNDSTKYYLVLDYRAIDKFQGDIIMKVKMLAAIMVSGILAVSMANAAPLANDGSGMNDNFGNLQGPQLADNGMSGNGMMSGPSNMSGTPSNNMSGTPSNNMSGSASPSDEGGADTATGDDY